MGNRNGRKEGMDVKLPGRKVSLMTTGAKAINTYERVRYAVVKAYLNLVEATKIIGVDDEQNTVY